MVDIPLMFWTTYKRERAAELKSLPTEELLEMASTIDNRERAAELSSLSSQADDTSYRPPRLPTRTPTTIQIPDSPRPQRSTANWHNLRSPFIVSGVRLFEPRTIRLANKSTKSAQPRHSPSRRYDTPLASNARNGRKHMYKLRHRQAKSNTG